MSLELISFICYNIVALLYILSLKRQFVKQIIDFRQKMMRENRYISRHAANVFNSHPLDLPNHTNAKERSQCFI